MKRYGNIYEKIYDMENLKLAHKNAKKDKTHYREVQMVNSNIDYYLTSIQKMLKNKTYEVSPYKISKIWDKNKERELMKLPYYPDRIIQWAIMLQIEPIFMKFFTDFTCASIKHRGIHRASCLLTKYMKDKQGTQYCLKLDISKFYPSVNHEILKKLLGTKFKDNDLLDLLDLIIDSVPTNKGVPIGSYLSQYLANFYLGFLDHWLKEVHHVKYIIRYMDDIVILHPDKSYLHALRKQINAYLESRLDLTIKANWQVFPVAIRGIDFVGYRHFYSYKLLRKTTCKKFKAKMLALKRKAELTYSDLCAINSYRGWLEFCNSYGLRHKYLVKGANT